MCTLSGGGVDVELLEATGLDGDRLLGEVEGVLLDSALGDGEDCKNVKYGLKATLIMILSNAHIKGKTTTILQQTLNTKTF
jgi:hypothetical protein